MNRGQIPWLAKYARPRPMRHKRLRRPVPSRPVYRPLLPNPFVGPRFPHELRWVPTDLGVFTQTLEDLVKEMLRPMLKDWLDSNLPPLVERLVQRYIAKLAGQADLR